jgi:hypothetical protein
MTRIIRKTQQLPVENGGFYFSILLKKKKNGKRIEEKI